MADTGSSRQDGKTLTIRFGSEAERAHVDAHAARADLPVSTYARRVLLGLNPRKARRSTAERQDVARCLSVIGHIASTLRMRAPEVAADLDSDLQALGNLLKKALGRRHDR
jgi:hypothetical protein